MAQPPLSRAIQQLERRLGVVLLHRTPRAVALTEAGSVLLREARAALDAVEAAERRTRRAAVEPAGVVLATKAGAAGALLSKLLDAYAAEPGAVAVEVMLAEVTPLTDLPLPRWPRRGGGYPDGAGPQVRDHTQLFQSIALGRACAVVPESLRAHLRDDHATVPVPDAPAVTTVIAWPSHSGSEAVAGLVRTATRL